MLIRSTTPALNNAANRVNSPRVIPRTNFSALSRHARRVALIKGGAPCCDNEFINHQFRKNIHSAGCESIRLACVRPNFRLVAVRNFPQSRFRHRLSRTPSRAPDASPSHLHNWLRDFVTKYPTLGLSSRASSRPRENRSIAISRGATVTRR